MRAKILYTGPGLYMPLIRRDGSVLWIYDYSPDTFVGVYVPNKRNARTFADLYDTLAEQESAPLLAQMETA